MRHVSTLITTPPRLGVSLAFDGTLEISQQHIDLVLTLLRKSQENTRRVEGSARRFEATEASKGIASTPIECMLRKFTASMHSSRF